ncbi:hypothetical protein [Nostocoides australiense]
MTIEVANNRWSGVPFILRSGKALGRMRKEIVVTSGTWRTYRTGSPGRPGRTCSSSA